MGGCDTYDSGRKGSPAPNMKHGMRITARETRHEMYISYSVVFQNVTAYPTLVGL